MRQFGATSRATLACWDAKLPAHLGLPRPVGPYLVVRATRMISTNRHCIAFGTFKGPSGVDNWNADNWNTICAIADVNSSGHIGAQDNAVRYRVPFDAASFTTSGTTACPSALTVQIMNPEALQQTEGIVYAGTMNTQFHVGLRSQTWDDYFRRFVEFQAPRLMSAGKLALRGVQISSYPLSMSQISEFTILREAGNQDEDQPYSLTELSPQPEGWAPILVYNPNGITLQYLVTSEWRVRFDLSNPASGAHQYHPMHTDQQWNRLMQQAVSMGHGVLDIADVVSRAGSYLEPFVKTARAVP